MPSPTVSIIIPIFDNVTYVEEALFSVISQTYSNIEVIVIDGGSDADMMKRIESWMEVAQHQRNPNHRFTFLKQKNMKISEAINHGLSAAKGEFFTILHADDVYDIHRIEKLILRIDQEQGDLIFSAIKGMDEHSHPLPVGHDWRNEYENSIYHLANMPTVGFQLMQSNLAKCAGNLFFSRNIYHRVSNFKNFEFLYDYDFILRCLLVTEPIFLNEELYFYRVYDNKNTRFEINQKFRDRIK